MKKYKMKFGSKLIIYYLTSTIVFLLIIGFSVNIGMKFYGMRTVENQLIKQAISSLDYIKQTLYLQDKPSSTLSADLSSKITKELSAGNREIRIYDENLYLLSGHIDGIEQDFSEIITDKKNLDSALKGNYSYKSDGEDIFFAAPISFNQRIIGVLEIIYPLSLLNQILSKTTMVLIIAGLIFSIFIVILSFYLAKITVSPIKKLVYVSNEYSKQNFIPINIDGPYEIGQLSRSISVMGEKIQTYINRQNQFVSNVSHELKTPLTVIKGYSEFLIDEVKGNDDLEKAVYHLNSETDRLTKMVGELLTLSKMDSRDENYNMELVNFVNLVDNIVTSMKIRAHTKLITLIRNLDNDIYITGDIEKLSQVILNIVDNSIKYSYKSSEIKVLVERDDNYAILWVEDRGIGISKSEIDSVFERFYRSNNAKGYKGTGLGLSISKEIIEAHNGKIEVKSEEDKGTVVKIIFPISEKLLQD